MSEKPFYKKWWFIALMVFFGLAILGGILDKGKKIPENKENPKEALKSKGIELSAKSFFKEVSGNRIDNIKLLIEAGIDINTTDEKGKTALHYASGLNKIEMVKLLIEKGANVSKKDNNGKTPLASLPFIKNNEIAQILLQNGASMDEVESYKTTIKEQKQKEVSKEITKMNEDAKKGEIHHKEYCKYFLKKNYNKMNNDQKIKLAVSLSQTQEFLSDFYYNGQFSEKYQDSFNTAIDDNIVFRNTKKHLRKYGFKNPSEAINFIKSHLDLFYNNEYKESRSLYDKYKWRSKDHFQNIQSLVINLKKNIDKDIKRNKPKKAETAIKTIEKTEPIETIESIKGKTGHYWKKLSKKRRKAICKLFLEAYFLNSGIAKTDSEIQRKTNKLYRNMNLAYNKGRTFINQEIMILAAFMIQQSDLKN